MHTSDEVARVVDLLIPATALAADLPVYTRNPNDFASLTVLIEVHTI